MSFAYAMDRIWLFLNIVYIFDGTYKRDLSLFMRWGATWGLEVIILFIRIRGGLQSEREVEIK